MPSDMLTETEDAQPAPQPASANPQTPKEVTPAVTASVKKWVTRIRAARAHWEPDFKRMRDNMEFLAGFQWNSQEKMQDDRYVCNLVMKLVNQKVSQLYARNPRVVAQRRKRKDFQVWDGKMESLAQSAAMMAHPEADPGHSMMGAATIADYTKGRQMRDLIDNVGETAELVYSYQMDSQSPAFKTQMKLLVRQVITTGVGYIRVDFARDYDDPLSSVSNESTLGDRMKRAQEIMARIQSGDLDEDSAEAQTLADLFTTMNTFPGETQGLQERLVFDFPASTSVIPDPRCRCLKGFVGARWIAQEYLLPLSEVNAFFQKDLKFNSDSQLIAYNDKGEQTIERAEDTQKDETKAENRICVWNVYDFDTKTCFFVADGHDDYLKAPEPALPETKYFWPIHALTFNDVIVEEGQRATVFPPSDVQLVVAAQKEWNRSRQALREQRKANAPKYMTGKGWLTENDKDNIVNAMPNAIIELEGTAPNDDVGKKLAPFVHAPIDPMAYDTGPLNQDMFIAFGNEENAEPASAKSTATAATINEQARVTTTTSNVDDLDDFLSEVAESGGEIILREFSPDTVKRIAGQGAVWPEANKEEFIDLLYLKIIAASSGRPNRALELANWQIAAPILQQAGANPMFLVRETLKRLDDRLEVDEAFSLGPAQPMTPGMGAAPQQSGPPTGQPPGSGVQAPTQQGQMPGGAVPSMQRPRLRG